MERQAALTTQQKRTEGIYNRNQKKDSVELIRKTQVRLEQHTKIFASMCPDEILDYYDDYRTRQYYTTLMLGDVSGFTDLTEKYTKAGKGGPSKLTETLNSYIGAMVQEILSHNGDVLKFSGDAFIVMWKLQEGKIMRDLAIEAMQTACVIQKHFGTYETDIGVTLRVKLAIASGKTYFTSIGDPNTTSYYIITGKPVWDVKYAEGLCRGGDILVAPSSWQWANPNEYIYETLPDGVHTLIVACSGAWYDSKGNDITSIDESESDEYMFPGGSLVSLSSNRNGGLINLQNYQPEEQSFDQDEYSLRPKVIKMAKAQLKDALRCYMLRPVVRSVEMDEPLEYLTEMRQVVILFVNVVTATIGRKRLIALVDAAYKLVCAIVGGMQGCVNKTSLFDKDLMFLCIFGLRGDKHELESQIGLRCASKVREGLVGMNHIKSVTIGVTTGMTYCGVVGHILRREYTVIGMAVNKAARLMCAYSDKVICDRESFLHSHLEARHFILQEPRHLKGITNIGPVYEFQEQAQYKVSDLVWSKYPLLGREAEIKNFRLILASLVEYSTLNKKKRGSRPEHNTLIIKGDPRIGKTRLLDEITQNIPTGVPCNYVSLVSDDTKAPYSLIHLIFSMPLGFTLASTRKEREDKLTSRLSQINQPHFLCCLNQAFNVRFAISHRYKALTELEKRKILRKFLTLLTRNCFGELWVIIIDDAEYADDESMQIFDTMTKRDTVFFILSVGRKLTSEYRLPPAFLSRAKIIELAGIDKWYHAGLACQVLNVSGIPAELEKLIQEKSSGNPGWIESYLVSLVQAGGLVILTITKKDADLMGYVLPHVTMLKRFVSDTILADINLDVQRTDRWQMYRTSYRDSIISMTDVKNVFHKSDVYTEDEESMITVCKIPETFSLADADTEMTMDVMILKLFDSLTPLDQLLLKRASVLGEIINRHMLESLMESTSKREIGLAITKLFEIRVFGCGTGDFTKSSGPIIYFKNIRSLTLDTDVLCNCTGLVVPKELVDLPKYASCGLMRFKMTLFRNTTYRLLTENQKMELHSKALKYLQKYTRRCAACGEGHFGKLLGKTTVQADRKQRPPNIDPIFDNVQFDNTPTPIQGKNTTENKTLSCTSLCRRIERKPTNTFSNVDFNNCQCDLILMAVYTQMLDHCRGIGRNDMILTAILEFVEICLMSYNIPQARRLLSDAEVLLQQMFQSSEDELIVLPYLTAKIQTLLGKCYLESGVIAEAERMLETAMDNLDYKFPRTELIIDFKSTIQLEELRLRLICFNNQKATIIEEDTVNYTKQLADCLAQMFDVFRTKGMKKHARLAAIWGLNAALASNKDFFILCTSFTNMLITAHIYKQRNIISYLENKGIAICNEKQNTILELHELKVIAELYAGIFFLRWLTGRTMKAIKIGFVCVRMAHTIGSTFLKLLLLPRLAHLLMISCRHAEVVTQLRELEFTSRNDLDKSGRTWYYALCADVQLDTGLPILSFRNCEKYYLREGELMTSLRDPEAQKRYFTSMWLWCIRTEQWEASKLWNHQSSVDETVMDEHTVAATITTLKKLEGLLVFYVHKVNSRNVNAVVTMTAIRSVFKTIDKMIKIVKIVIPRYLLLKAYYYMIKSRKRAAIRLLQRAKKLSLKMENRMIYTWAEHCRKAWLGAMSSVQRDMWKEQSDKFVEDWDEINANDSAMVPFTFPLPKYTV